MSQLSVSYPLALYLRLRTHSGYQSRGEEGVPDLPQGHDRSPLRDEYRSLDCDVCRLCTYYQWDYLSPSLQ